MTLMAWLVMFVVAAGLGYVVGRVDEMGRRNR